MDFQDFPMILGNLGVETDHPPKMCARLAGTPSDTLSTTKCYRTPSAPVFAGICAWPRSFPVQAAGIRIVCLAWSGQTARDWTALHTR